MHNSRLVSPSFLMRVEPNRREDAARATGSILSAVPPQIKVREAEYLSGQQRHKQTVVASLMSPVKPDLHQLLDRHCFGSAWNVRSFQKYA